MSRKYEPFSKVIRGVKNGPQWEELVGDEAGGVALLEHRRGAAINVLYFFTPAAFYKTYQAGQTRFKQ